MSSRWFCSFVPLFIDGTFGNKSWGCCGSARIYITLQCQNDKHCADVPQDSHPVCLRPWHIATTEYISSASRRCSMSSVTFLFRQTSGTKINQNQKLVAFKNNIMIPFQNVHQSYNGSMLGEARSETIKMSPWKPKASSPAQLSPQANSCWVDVMCIEQIMEQMYRWMNDWNNFPSTLLTRLMKPIMNNTASLCVPVYVCVCVYLLGTSSWFEYILCIFLMHSSWWH